MSAVDTLPVRGDLTKAGAVSLNNIQTLVGGSKLQSVTSVVVTPGTAAYGFIGFFQQDAAPSPGDAMPAATFPVGPAQSQITFDPNAMVPNKTRGNLYYAWSLDRGTFRPAIAAGLPERDLGLLFNTIIQGASFFAPRWFTACTGKFLTTGAAKDISIIAGAAGRIINVRGLEISNDAAVTTEISVLRRSTANGAGGTVVAKVPNDPITAASLATVLSYTANPASDGTLVGLVRDRFGVQPSFPNVYNFGQGEYVLRASTDVMAVNLQGTGGPNYAVTWIWTEEFSNP